MGNFATTPIDETESDWKSEMDKNFRIIDAILKGISPILWQPSTSYPIGTVVTDPESRLWFQSAQTHVSGTGTFSEDRASSPGNWDIAQIGTNGDPYSSSTIYTQEEETNEWIVDNIFTEGAIRTNIEGRIRAYPSIENSETEIAMGLRITNKSTSEITSSTSAGARVNRRYSFDSDSFGNEIDSLEHLELGRVGHFDSDGSYFASFEIDIPFRIVSARVVVAFARSMQSKSTSQGVGGYIQSYLPWGSSLSNRYISGLYFKAARVGQVPVPVSGELVVTTMMP